MTTDVAPVSLTPDQIENYHTDGYLILRGVFGANEVAALADEAQTLMSREALIDSANIRCRWQDHVATGECMFDCFDPVIDIGPVCRFVARDERILAPLRALYGDEAYLFKDKLIFKRPGAKGYALHQDYIGWKEFPESFVTVILAIDPTDAGNGATEVFPGYHRQGCLSVKDGDYHELPPEEIDASRGVVLDLQPGDLAIFSGFTPHRSAPNLSDRWRRQLYLSYNAGRDGGDQRQAHYRQFHAWLKEKYAEYGKTDVYFR
ncbi:MAG TPA: phytanoyl-CoA dioxygenase family protein [Pirellulales bacterium]|nr:phytanoyl-CoA dioxygenase family protein [Pirellulales bacterium]